MVVGKKCKWCKSEIDLEASFCKECNQWQSSKKLWLSPNSLLALFGALAAWCAVAYQLVPQSSPPELVALQNIEKLDLKGEEGCTNNKTNACINEFWKIYGTADDARQNIVDLETRKSIEEQLELVMKKHGQKFVEAYEFEDF